MTLDLPSDLDLRVLSSSLALGSLLGTEPTLKKKKVNRRIEVFISKKRESNGLLGVFNCFY